MIVVKVAFANFSSFSLSYILTSVKCSNPLKLSFTQKSNFPFFPQLLSPDFIITHFSVGKRMIITIEEMFPSMRLNRKIKGGLCQNSRHSNDPKTDMDSAVRGCVRLSLKVLTIPLNSHRHQLSINPIFKA